jgi:hypothetical protein
MPKKPAKALALPRDVVIENIGALRRYEGIEDPQLEQDIAGLQVGDCVKLTLMSRTVPALKETVLVRLTRVQHQEFRGKLASLPASARLTLPLGTPLAFSPAHIHSLPRKEVTRGS